MDPLHAVFDRYKLDDLDRSWINQVCESGFSNIENVPVDYHIFLESADMIGLLKDTCAIVKDWIEKNRDARTNKHDEVSWETLIALNLEVQALLSVLAYLMKKGQMPNLNEDSRQSCICATSLYFVLLAIPGSNAFQAFQPNLYEIALKTLELSQCLIQPEEKSRKQRHCDDFEDNHNEEETEYHSGLSKSQNITLTKGLNTIMYDLVMMLKSTSTIMELRSIQLTIYYLVEITKLAKETVHVETMSNARASSNSLAYNAYVALESICDPKYAPVRVIARLIGKYTLPQFLATGTSLPIKQLSIIRESTLYFWKKFLTTHGKDAQSALTTMIQHAMIKCPERLDGRQKQAAIIVKLFNLCRNDEITLKRCIIDLALLSNHNKISCRLFAQEIIGKFLSELSTMRMSRTEYVNNYYVDKIEKILLAAALGRCCDISSMVRGRAIATIAEYTESVNKPEVREIFEKSLESVNREMPSLEDLEIAIESGNVDTLMPDKIAIMEMLKNRLEDERALVRRSALQILRNGVEISPELLNDAIPIIRQHCRDSILTVRRYAIRVLTLLMEQFPDTPKLCEYWVDSVVPRVFDSEAKVQEEVLNCLEILTIGKIKRHRDDNDSSEETTPWAILRELANHKMVDHLARACSVWIDCTILTETKISIIKTHIGTSNNVGAWLMLASISVNKKIKNMEKYCMFYDGSLIDLEKSDAFLASLALRVLKNCWSSFDDTSLLGISRYLTNCLKSYRIKVPLIRLCMDILLEVTRHLEKTNNENAVNEGKPEIMRELLKLSETIISGIIEMENDDNSGDRIFRAVCTLGHASFLSWTQISLDTRRILQGFLLEWSSLPNCIRDQKELQGAAITVLGQQALIDREIAVEMTPIFGRLLCNMSSNSHRQVDGDNESIASGPIVRINAAKALADICVRFTALVEPYLTDMCISMKDPNPEVRQVILVIFIQLLVEDTIKINEAFFFHILTMLADDDSTIRQMTVFLIKERLLAKNKSLITQQFINAIYHFNDYETRRTSVLNNRRRRSRKIDDDDNRTLSLAGEENDDKRRIIYDFMLENLDPPGKLTIIGKLTGQILNTRGNNILDVSCEKGVSIIRDVLYLVASEHLQVNSCTRQTINEDNNAEEGTTLGHASANTVIIEAMKKHRIQVFLPNLVELKRRCEELKSPVVVDIAKFLFRTIEDCNKDALASLYNEYPNLEREMQRDIRKYSIEENNSRSGSSCENNIKASPKKLLFEKHSLLINSNRTPRIVLRRLSTLTYPEISGWFAKSNETIVDISRDTKKSPSRTPKCPQKNKFRQ